MSLKIDDYMNRKMNAPAIGGWLSPEDAKAMWLIDRAQRVMSISGDLLEVGVYQGKTLALMAMFASDTERVTGIDSFSHGRSDHKKTVDWLQANEVSARLIKADTQHEHSGFMDLGSRTFRMIHIDGDHSYLGAHSDLMSFSPLLVDQGVMVVDDYYQRNDPGVHRAAIKWAERTGRVQFMASMNKAFFCTASLARAYVSVVLLSTDPGTSRLDMIEGAPLLTIDVDNPNKRMTDELIKEML